ncbi:flagellar assembly protein FliH [Aquibacillus salsiterrae]|uniref:Flagellar assembly protein FliH n=1 Tax=Aquibacillus salsiterrae TaxID=2950439 RepID=A0A9X4AE73_9BACI|nr:flagellar assembly protein FliH [Aquibacillus salsiterrae]MDC3416396.1 flagellar assembly protein FliH [Aquibacillus salsiterrae]
MSSIFKTTNDDFSSRVIGIKPIYKKENGEKQEQTNPKAEELKKVEENLRQVQRQLESTKLEINQTVTKAKQQREMEKKQWEKEKEQYKEEAYREGYDAGFEIGKQNGYTEYEHLISEAQEVIRVAKADAAKRVIDSEATILEFGLTIASKILMIEITEKDTFLSLVKEVIREVKDQPTIALYVNVEDYQQVIVNKEDIVSADSKADLSIYPDNSLSRGSCIVESPFGKIDASIDSQLEEVRSHLLEMHREQASK